MVMVSSRNNNVDIDKKWNHKDPADSYSFKWFANNCKKDL